MDDSFFFEGGYAELYLYKFKKYNSSVGKYIQDMKLRCSVKGRDKESVNWWKIVVTVFGAE